MDVQKLERLARKYRFVPRRRINTRHGDILLAERYENFDGDEMKPHWEVSYMLTQGTGRIGQVLHFKFGTPFDARMAAAETVARQFLADWLEVQANPNPAEAHFGNG